MLKAYFDESERIDGAFSVAGYVFYPEQWKKLCKSWRRLMGDRIFRATDVMTGHGEFSLMTESERIPLLQQLGTLLRSRMAHGVAFSCSLRDYDAYAPTGVVGLKHAYSFACDVCMVGISDWMNSSNIRGTIAYAFEAGQEFQSDANAYMNRIAADPFARSLYRYGGHAFLPKESSEALQAADWLAWEWSKYISETLWKPQRKMRKSLQMLLAGPAAISASPGDDLVIDRHLYHMMHMHEERVRMWMDGWKEKIARWRGMGIPV